MKRQDFRFFHRLRVRWAEVDMQKIVFNAHYLMYFDTAVADYWRALALPYEEAMHQLGGDLYVKKATVEFNASARMDDRLDIGLKCGRIGNSSMAFTRRHFPRRGAADHLRAGLRVRRPGHADVAAGAAAAARNAHRLRGGRSRWCRCRTGTWAELGDDAAPIRTRGVRRGAAHSRRDGMGRGRRDGRSRGGLQPAGPARGHRAPAAAAARRGARSAAWRCTRCCAAAGVGRQVLDGAAGRGRARAATAKRCCMRSAAPRTSTRGLGFSRAASRSRKPASPTSRCHAALAR